MNSVKIQTMCVVRIPVGCSPVTLDTRYIILLHSWQTILYNTLCQIVHYLSHVWMAIRMDLQEMGCGYMDWIGLAQDRDRWRTLVSAVMNIRVP